MISKLFLLLPIVVHAPVDPDTLSALSKNIESIKFLSAEWIKGSSDVKNVTEENKSIYGFLIACTVVKLEQILNFLETGPVSEATYEAISNILR